MSIQLKNYDSGNRNINFLYLAIINVFYFYTFFKTGYTAYEWPANDMFSFFERAVNPNYLKNDLFTNSTTDPNPRWIFGYFILFIAKALHVNWYSVVYFFKVAYVVSIPSLYYLLVYLFADRVTNHKFSNRIQTIVFLGTILIIRPFFFGLFSIAWWAPITTQSNAQTTSLFFGFITMVLFELQIVKKYVLVILFAVTSLFHPAIGLFIIALHFILNYDALIANNKYFTAVFLAGFVFPALVLKLFFSPNFQLNTTDFINIYVKERHPAHYQFSKFGSLTSHPWTTSFYLMLFLLLVPCLYFYFKRNQKLFRLSILFALSLLIAVFAQLVFIDFIPIKFVAIVGPVRFIQFIYWMILILWTILISEVVYIPSFNFSSNVYKGLYSALLVTLFIVAIANIDNPKKDIVNKNIALARFIKKTDAKSVFILHPDGPEVDITCIYGRSVVAGSRFPFNERYFNEYIDRYRLAYGTQQDLAAIKGDSDGEKRATFYRQLSPANFKTIANHYKLDYVMIERGFSDKFKPFKPAFADDYIAIYNMKDLR